jgi:hypothetical protein
MFVGIAGALKDEVAVGDVVVGTEVAWTERGKWHEAPGYLPRIRTVSLSFPLSQWARKVARDGTWAKRLKLPRANANAFVQQIASGEKVVAGEEYRSWLRKAFSDAYAIENEGFALARAGEVYADGQRCVIRGISDTADGNKSDQGQPNAADAAAAFAFELLDAYSSVQATVALPPSPSALLGDGEGTTEDGELGDLSVLAHDLIHDVDLLDDNRGKVEDLARHVVAHGADADLSQLLSDIGVALGGNNGPLIDRRLFWFGRQLVISAGNRLAGWPLEAAVKTAPIGMAMLLTEPMVWGYCPDGARRRCLTALLGAPDPPVPAGEFSIAFIAPLLRAGALSDSEASRVQASFDLASFDLLIARGVTIEMLVPRIVADLDSGEFARQNAAARFLYGLAPELASQPIDPSRDFSLGAKLVEATIGGYHSWGADEAMAWPYVSTWSPVRLAGGIWAAVAWDDGQLLRIPASAHLPNLIAAAAGTGRLNEILGVVGEMLDSSLRQVPGDFPEAGKELFALAEKYMGDDRSALISFGGRLRKRQAGSL